MKKLIALTVVALFTTALFAQDKAEKKAETTASKSMMHECYKMKDGSLIHCMGEKEEAQMKTVTLKNGTVIMPSGEMKTKDGKESKLENGQCVSLMGSVGDCGKMHSTTKQRAEGAEPVKKSDDVIVK